MKKNLLVTGSVILACVLTAVTLFAGDRLINGNRLKLRKELPVRVAAGFGQYEDKTQVELTLEENRALIEEFIAYLKEYRYDDYFEMPFILGPSYDSFGLTYSDGEYWSIALVEEKGLQVRQGSGKEILYYARNKEEFAEKCEYFREKFLSAEEKAE